MTPEEITEFFQTRDRIREETERSVEKQIEEKLAGSLRSPDWPDQVSPWEVPYDRHHCGRGTPIGLQRCTYGRVG